MRFGGSIRVAPALSVALLAGMARGEWFSVGACGSACSTAGQACADAAAFHHRALLSMYPGYFQGRLVGYFCDLDPLPINIGDSFTSPVCNLLTEQKDATTTGGCVAKVHPRQLGDECGQAGNPQVGNPVTIVNGNKYLEQVDFESGGYERLSFERFYNSLEQPIAVTTTERPTLLGTRWRANWDGSLGFISTVFAIARRPDGQEIEFSKVQGQWRLSNSYQDLPYRLVESGGSFHLHDDDDTVETYDAGGRLVSRRTRSGYAQNLIYAPDGKLAEVADSYGRSLHFAYDGNRVGALTAPGGHVIRFEYQPLNDFAAEPKILRSVVYPDGTPDDPEDNPRVIYLYEDARFPQAVTGIIDESENRFATYAYDELGRAVLTTHAGGADSYTIEYTAADTRTVTNPLGKQTIHRYGMVAGIPRITRVDGVPNGTCEARNSGYSYHPATGMLMSSTDWNGNRTDYVFNSRGLEESRTEAAGTPLARTSTTSWHPGFRLPTMIAAPGVTATFTYDPNGRLLVRTEADTTDHGIPYSTNGRLRSWSFTYNGSGQVETVDGPRTDHADITRYDYDGSGNLLRVINALGHVSHAAEHDPRGLPRFTIDPNGVTTELIYDDRGRLTSHSVGGATTEISYRPTGVVRRIGLPNGAFFLYEHDAAQRLTAMENSAGERIELALDGMGNATEVVVKDGGGTVTYRHRYAFDGLGRLIRDIGAEEQTAAFGYDRNGNVTLFRNARQFASISTFDALDRLRATTDALDGVTDFAYDARDNLTRVADPRGVATAYVYNGFGELIHESSPDAGTTTLRRDDAGNVIERIDGRGILTRYAYDAMNRLVSESFPGNSAEDREYQWDNPAPGGFGIGRLHRAIDDSGSTSHAYDARGNTVKSTRHIKGFGRKGVTYVSRFVYDDADQLTRTIYPSGRIVDYERDPAGRPARITTRKRSGEPPVEIAAAITHSPFGGVKNWSYGNGLLSRTEFDLDYRVARRAVSDDVGDLYDVSMTFDANGNVASIIDAIDMERSQSFVYDALDRLTEASSGDAGKGIYGVESYAYDAAGNRTAKNAGGQEESYAYEPESNRLVSVAHDAAITRAFSYSGSGDMAADERYPAGPSRSLAYNHAGRLSNIGVDGEPVVAFRYNALGERVLKTTMPRGMEPAARGSRNPAEDAPTPELLGGSQSASKATPSRTTEIHYHYDLNRMLIAESAGGGTPIREYIYLPLEAGAASGLAIPLAQIDATRARTGEDRLSFVVCDHLYTPVILTDTERRIVWRRGQTPFGETADEQEARGTNIRFPGQYFDPESGLHYNMFRDYDPGLGRYIESDPIGIAGGMNRFAYVSGNPATYVDPDGLFIWGLLGRIGAAGLARLGALLSDEAGIAATAAKTASTAERTAVSCLGATSALRLSSLGRPGASKGVREVIGDARDARRLFDQLRGGNPVREIKSGVFQSAGARGGNVTFRVKSKSGPATVDVHGIEAGIRKIKFIGE